MPEMIRLTCDGVTFYKFEDTTVKPRCRTASKTFTGRHAVLMIYLELVFIRSSWLPRHEIRG